MDRNFAISISYSPPAEADTGNTISTNSARKAPRKDNTRVVTTAQRIVVPRTLPPNLFFLRLAVPAASVTIDVPRNKNAATPVRYEVKHDIIPKRDDEEEKVNAVAHAIRRAAEYVSQVSIIILRLQELFLYYT